MRRTWGTRVTVVAAALALLPLALPAPGSAADPSSAPQAASRAVVEAAGSGEPHGAPQRDSQSRADVEPQTGAVTRLVVEVRAGSAAAEALAQGPGDAGAQAPDDVDSLAPDEAGVLEAAALHPATPITDDLFVVEVPAAAASTAAAQLRADPDVVTVVPDAPAELASVEPDDPLYREHQWGLRRIEAPRAWSLTTGSEETVIAILDTGVDPEHPELVDALLPGHDFVHGRPGAIDDHPDHHGTVVAGIAAARGDNGIGIAGVCWRCRILPVKVMDGTGQGWVSTIIQGIYWAADEGADIINLSLGSGLGEDALHDDLRRQLRAAVRYAHDAGAIVVAAAGNTADERRFYPAAFPEVVAVAASNRNDDRELWSTHGSWVEVAAPGCTPWLDAADAPVRTACGTSVSAPLVSGSLGLAHAHNPEPGPLRAALLQTARPVGPWVERGRLDAGATVQAAALRAGVALQPVDPTPLERRVSGTDRYRTAANLARETFPRGVRRVYLTTGEDFPDGLAASMVAASTDAPVLLTRPDRLSTAAAEGLDHLRPAEIVVVGGSGAVSPAVLDAVRQVTGVTPRRVAGGDRYATAAALAGDAFDGSAFIVYVATGAAFADALAIGPAGARLPGPVLLTRGDVLPDATRAALETLAPSMVVVVGGEAAVSADVAATIGTLTGASVERWAGTDRYETAAVIAAETGLGQGGTVMLASGATFPDALASGSAARREHAPLLLAQPDRLPASTATALAELHAQQLLVLGGPAALSQSVVDAAAGR